MCKHANDENVVHESIDFEVVKNLILQCKQLRIPSINIGSGTECTLHPKFREIALMIKETGAIDKFFLTNGTTLTDQIVDVIFEGDYERVEISVDAATSDTYSKIRRGGNLQHVEEGIERIIDRRNNKGVRLPIIRLSFCVQDTNEAEIDCFYEKWKDKVDIIEFQKVQLPEVKQYKEILACDEPFNRLTVNYKGDIFPCCSIHYQDKYTLGNIKEVSLLDAWTGERMQALRKSLLDGEPLTHCRECIMTMA